MDGKLLNGCLESDPGAPGRSSHGKAIKLGTAGGLGIGWLNRKRQISQAKERSNRKWQSWLSAA